MKATLTIKRSNHGEKFLSLVFTPKSHIEISGEVGMVDLGKGAKISGFRGYFENDAVLLSFAIWQFVSDHLILRATFRR